MELMRAIHDRRSIRKFLPDTVDEKDLEEIIHAGTLAINAENKQMWYFVAVTNKGLIEQACDAVSDRVDSLVNACRVFDQGEVLANHKYFMTFFRSAPAVIAVFAAPFDDVIEKAMGILNVEFKAPIPLSSAQQSVGAAIQNISLVAHSKGYGTTCMYAPVLAYREIGELLEVIEPFVLTALIPIGKPAQHPKARPRKSLGEVYKFMK